MEKQKNKILEMTKQTIVWLSMFILVYLKKCAF